MLDRQVLVVVMAIVLFGCDAPGPVFLSRPGVGSAAETLRYYKNINAELTLDEWKAKRCFNDATDLAANYYNDSDLGLGREMRCAMCPSTALVNPNLKSCVVSNHGVPQGLDAKDNQRSRGQSIQKAIRDLESFLATKNPPRGASVAMDYLAGRPDAVRFYIYDSENPDPAKLTAGNLIPGGLIPAIQLDTEGVKSIRNCLSCHGGSYDESKELIFGSSFLDFLVSLFVFGDDDIVKTTPPKEGDATLMAKQTLRSANSEGLRKLNEFVLTTQPAAAIQDRIQKSYPCGVQVAGCLYDANYVPDSWQADRETYQKVLHPYCTTCHFAQTAKFNLHSDKEANKLPWIFAEKSLWDEPQNQKLILQSSCESIGMPHAEVTYYNMKRDSAAFSRICVVPR